MLMLRYPRTDTTHKVSYSRLLIFVWWKFRASYKNSVPQYVQRNLQIFKIQNNWAVHTNICTQVHIVAIATLYPHTTAQLWLTRVAVSSEEGTWTRGRTTSKRRSMLRPLALRHCIILA